MPPLRSDRASRACDSCRKLKTRCYPSKDRRGTCLRCETQVSACSLAAIRPTYQSSDQLHNGQDHVQSGLSGGQGLMEQRLANLEKTMDRFMDRINSRLDTLLEPAGSTSTSNGTDETRTSSSTPVQHEAPMLLIRDAAADIGIRSPENTVTTQLRVPDIVSRDIITFQEAYDLLCLFRTHYGRWVIFDDTLSDNELLLHVRRSPLLLCSICLVAVRHTNQQLATTLAPSLFGEAKDLLQSSILSFPQQLEFFQATLVLSLWSTTIGQIPLSLDSWLLSGYALQQAFSNPTFMDISRSISHTPRNSEYMSARCLLNHLCLAHLQYCVGTRRRSLLTQKEIDECGRALEYDNIPQFEMRMVAEVKLYWIIYTQCCAPKLNISGIRAALSVWKREWIGLFDEPRSQFLQMGHHFAILLTHCRSLQSNSTSMRSSTLIEMVQLARDIINLAIDNTDERTSHLTDHIYHIVTFSAITLCRLLQTYRGKLGGHNVEASLDNLILQLVDWLRSIGLPCHVSRVLGDVIAAYHARLRPRSRPGIRGSRALYAGSPPTAIDASADRSNISTSLPPYGLSIPSAPTTPMVSHIDPPIALSGPDQDFSWAACFDFDAGAMEWPQYEESTDGGSVTLLSG